MLRRKLNSAERSEAWLQAVIRAAVRLDKVEWLERAMVKVGWKARPDAIDVEVLTQALDKFGLAATVGLYVLFFLSTVRID